MPGNRLCPDGRRSVGTALPLLPQHGPVACYSCCDQIATFYLLRTGCRLFFRGSFQPGHRVPLFHYFRMWKYSGVWTRLQREIYEEARRKAGRSACPRNHGQAIGKDNRTRRRSWLYAHKRVKGRKRHILVDTLGLPIACRVEPANLRPLSSLPSARWLRSVVSRHSHRYC